MPPGLVKGGRTRCADRLGGLWTFQAARFGRHLFGWRPAHTARPGGQAGRTKNASFGVTPGAGAVILGMSSPAGSARRLSLCRLRRRARIRAGRDLWKSGSGGDWLRPGRLRSGWRVEVVRRPR